MRVHKYAQLVHDYGSVVFMNKGTVGQSVGENLYRLRVKAVESQSDCAKRVNEWGMNWAQSHVSTFESGKRSAVTVEELMILSWAYNVPMSEWFEGTGTLGVGNVDNASRSEVRIALQGKRPTRVIVDFSEAEDTSADDSIARSMGIDSEAVQEMAVDLWGHTATTERDRRLSEHKGKTPKELRTLRGGMTKRLRREIEQRLVSD